MRNRIRPLILLLALVGLLAFGYWRVRQDAAAAEGPVEAAGSIEATQIDVAPELSVHRLARIDPPAQTGAEAD